MICPHCGNTIEPVRPGLTVRQGECLDFIKAYTEKHAVAPTYMEIAQNMGIRAKSGVHRYVQSLESRGAIVRLPGHPRSLRVVE